MVALYPSGCLSIQEIFVVSIYASHHPENAPHQISMGIYFLLGYSAAEHHQHITRMHWKWCSALCWKKTRSKQKNFWSFHDN